MNEIFTSSQWQTLFWLCAILMIGVVGKYYIEYLEHKHSAE